MNIVVAIPAFNESKVIGGVIAEVKKVLTKAQVVVIDDGSSDNTAAVAKSGGAVVISHEINRGLGGAIGTAVEYAKLIKAEVLVTIDADGQHDPVDILPALELINNNRADVVIGSRLLNNQYGMPIDRRIINRIANWLTWLMFGVKTTDSQSGFRVLSKTAINGLILRTNRMEVSSEVFAEIYRLKLKYAEVPIKVIYTDYSRSKGQTNLNALAVGFRLLLRLFR